MFSVPLPSSDKNFEQKIKLINYVYAELVLSRDCTYKTDYIEVNLAEIIFIPF